MVKGDKYVLRKWIFMRVGAYVCMCVRVCVWVGVGVRVRAYMNE